MHRGRTPAKRHESFVFMHLRTFSQEIASNYFQTISFHSLPDTFFALSNTMSVELFCNQPLPHTLQNTRDKVQGELCFFFKPLAPVLGVRWTPMESQQWTPSFEPLFSSPPYFHTLINSFSRNPFRLMLLQNLAYAVPQSVSFVLPTRSFHQERFTSLSFSAASALFLKTGGVGGGPAPPAPSFSGYLSGPAS